MIEIGFILFSSAVAIAFFVGSLILMNFGSRLGAMRLARGGAQALTGLAAAEGAVFALMGLVLAFAISGALQRFDERKQLVLQEANAVGTAYDRLDFLQNDVRSKLKAKFRDYVGARIELYRQPATFSLSGGAELFSREQQAKILALKSEIWNEAVAACSMASTSAAGCLLVTQSLNTVFEAARLRLGANERHPPQIIYVMLFGLGTRGIAACGLRHGCGRQAEPGAHGDVRGGFGVRAFCRHRYRISPPRPRPRGRFRSFPDRRPSPDEVRECLERAKGFEPSTPTLARSCSTPELHPHP